MPACSPAGSCVAWSTSRTTATGTQQQHILAGQVRDLEPRLLIQWVTAGEKEHEGFAVTLGNLARGPGTIVGGSGVLLRFLQVYVQNNVAR